MEVKKGFQMTEAGYIPNDWCVKKISEVCKLVNGRGFKPFEWQSEGLPIIRIQNLNGSTEFNYFQGPYHKKLEIERGQLLFAWSGSRGTSFGPHIWNGPKGVLNYHTWKVVVDEEKIDKYFFNHSLKNLTKYIEDKAHGASALVHTQKWEMEGFKFPLPKNRKEQTAIATALSDTDALIGSLEKLIAKKRNIKQGAMHELLKPKRGWIWKKLEEIGEIDLDNLASTTNPEYAFKYISLEDVDCGTMRSFTEMVFKNAPSRARRRIKKNDILISTVRPNLKSHLLFMSDISNWVCSTGFSVLRCNNKIANSGFVFNHFFFSCINQQIESLISGSNYPAISSRDVKQLKIPMPSIEEQASIARILTDMDTEISAFESKLSKYRQIKAGMMQNLLTGKIRLV